MAIGNVILGQHTDARRTLEWTRDEGNVRAVPEHEEERGVCHDCRAQILEGRRVARIGNVAVTWGIRNEGFVRGCFSTLILII